MAKHDIKGDKLQINRILSKEQIRIVVQNILSYTEAFQLEDLDLVYKKYVDDLFKEIDGGGGVANAKNGLIVAEDGDVELGGEILRATELFIIEGRDYNLGISNIQKVDFFEDHYYISCQIGGDWTIAKINTDFEHVFQYGIFSNVIWDFVINPDGTLVATGMFTQYEGTTYNRAVKLNQDGTVDTSFDIGTGFNAGSGGFTNVQNTRVIRLSDSTLVFSGQFTTYNGITRGGIIRLNQDGTMVTADGWGGVGIGTGGTRTVWDIKPQSDGKLVFVGNFGTYNGDSTPTQYIARLNSDGTLDAGFAPTITLYNDLLTVLIRPNDKIVAGGFRSQLIQLNADGTTDNSFNGGQNFTGTKTVNLSNKEFKSLELLSNGDVLVGGAGRFIDDPIDRYLIKVNTAGEIVPEFNTHFNGYVTRTYTNESENYVLVFGNFTNYRASVVHDFAEIELDTGDLIGIKKGAAMVFENGLIKYLTNEHEHYDSDRVIPDIGWVNEFATSQDSLIVETVGDLSTAQVRGRTTAIVRDNARGGNFYSRPLSDNLTPNGGTIFQGNGVYWVRDFSGPVHLKWFGVNGDGVADNKTQLEAALDIGGEIIAENGNFKVGSVIEPNKDFSLIGSGDTYFFGDGAIAMLRFRQNVKFSLKNIKIHGYTSGLRADGLDSDVFDLDFDNLEIYDCDTAVNFTNGIVTNCKIINSSFHNTKRGVFFHRYIENLHVEKTKFYDIGNEYDGIYDTNVYVLKAGFTPNRDEYPESNINIHKCEFKNLKGGIKPPFSGTGYVVAIHNDTNRSNITKCTFENISVDEGVTNESAQSIYDRGNDVHHSGNKFFNAGLRRFIGLKGNGNNNVTITDNQMETDSLQQVTLLDMDANTSGSLIFQGNKIEAVSAEFNLTRVNEIDFSGNIIKTNNSCAVLFFENNIVNLFDNVFQKRDNVEGGQNSNLGFRFSVGATTDHPGIFEEINIQGNSFLFPGNTGNNMIYFQHSSSFGEDPTPEFGVKTLKITGNTCNGGDHFIDLNDVGIERSLVEGNIAFNTNINRLVVIKKDVGQTLNVRNNFFRGVFCKYGEEREHGTTAQTPESGIFPGAEYIDTDMKVPLFWDGEKYTFLKKPRLVRGGANPTTTLDYIKFYVVFPSIVAGNFLIPEDMFSEDDEIEGEVEGAPKTLVPGAGVNIRSVDDNLTIPTNARFRIKFKSPTDALLTIASQSPESYITQNPATVNQLLLKPREPRGGANPTTFLYYKDRYIAFTGIAGNFPIPEDMFSDNDEIIGEVEGGAKTVVPGDGVNIRSAGDNLIIPTNSKFKIKFKSPNDALLTFTTESTESYLEENSVSLIKYIQNSNDAVTTSGTSKQTIIDVSQGSLIFEPEDMAVGQNYQGTVEMVTEAFTGSGDISFYFSLGGVEQGVVTIPFTLGDGLVIRIEYFLRFIGGSDSSRQFVFIGEFSSFRVDGAGTYMATKFQTTPTGIKTVNAATAKTLNLQAQIDEEYIYCYDSQLIRI